MVSCNQSVQPTCNQHNSPAGWLHTTILIIVVQPTSRQGSGSFPGPNVYGLPNLANMLVNTIIGGGHCLGVVTALWWSGGHG